MAATPRLRPKRLSTNGAAHDGDGVVFYGDSITEAASYTTFVESYVLTRFPGFNVAFVNSEWEATAFQAEPPARLRKGWIETS
jgi:hypothetical protein